MVERTSHLAPPSLPSLILGPIISRGWRVPAALTRHQQSLSSYCLSFLVHIHLSPPANRPFRRGAFFVLIFLKCLSAMYPSLVSHAHVYFSRAIASLQSVARMTPRNGSAFVPFRGQPTRTERRWGFVFSGTGFECPVGVHQTPCLVTRPASWASSTSTRNGGPLIHIPVNSVGKLCSGAV